MEPIAENSKEAISLHNFNSNNDAFINHPINTSTNPRSNGSLHLHPHSKSPSNINSKNPTTTRFSGRDSTGALIVDPLPNSPPPSQPIHSSNQKNTHYIPTNHGSRNDSYNDVGKDMFKVRARTSDVKSIKSDFSDFSNLNDDNKSVSSFHGAEINSETGEPEFIYKPSPKSLIYEQEKRRKQKLKLKLKEKEKLLKLNESSKNTRDNFLSNQSSNQNIQKFRKYKKKPEIKDLRESDSGSLLDEEVYNVRESRRHNPSRHHRHSSKSKRHSMLSNYVDETEDSESFALPGEYGPPVFPTNNKKAFSPKIDSSRLNNPNFPNNQLPFDPYQNQNQNQNFIPNQPQMNPMNPIGQMNPMNPMSQPMNPMQNQIPFQVPGAFVDQNNAMYNPSLVGPQQTAALYQNLLNQQRFANQMNEPYQLDEREEKLKEKAAMLSALATSKTQQKLQKEFQKDLHDLKAMIKYLKEKETAPRYGAFGAAGWGGVMPPVPPKLKMSDGKKSVDADKAKALDPAPPKKEEKEEDKKPKEPIKVYSADDPISPAYQFPFESAVNWSSFLLLLQRAFSDHKAQLNDGKFNLFLKESGTMILPIHWSQSIEPGISVSIKFPPVKKEIKKIEGTIVNPPMPPKPKGLFLFGRKENKLPPPVMGGGLGGLDGPRGLPLKIESKQTKFLAWATEADKT
ncbi:uncharacterized protein ASCRUDRAFT_71785 [Ascoidea rubescens DSM 1968]|uniref:Ubiquitin-like domain-containing protein n=1 Tax=Ascoidea rubescens DSM 1968 TaxID=1344418 RepID=A0A1D2VD94_9ASCO|nr:hypothetical protein ASCRUDRAFT_71785 [Ascoidea rubescens DSM 1968]ODV59437.1 hypothetical protein ASCRUDRAFT_71785 [Ascoidea rubescens DSM 1968]